MEYCKGKKRKEKKRFNFHAVPSVRVAGLLACFEGRLSLITPSPSFSEAV